MKRLLIICVCTIIFLSIGYPAIASVDLSGEYWFGSLSADVATNVPWGKRGTVSISGNQWNQQWDANDGHHTFSSTFTNTILPDNSIDINFPGETYNVAWNSDVMIHAGSVLGGGGEGIDIFTRKATNVDANDVLGDHSVFGHQIHTIWPGDSSGWGAFTFDPNGTAPYTWTNDHGVIESDTFNWTLDDVNSVLNVVGPNEGAFFLGKGGIGCSWQIAPEEGRNGDLGYNIFIKKTDQVITMADIAGTYQVRFLETGPGGVPYTCGQGTCVINAIDDVNGTLSIDAYYSNGEHDINDINCSVGPGNEFHLDDDSVPDGIISPGKSLIFAPEYRYENPPTREDYDWLGGIFLIRVSNNIADLSGDRYVNFKDYSFFASDWLKNDTELSANFNHDGQVNGLDLKIFADNWLQDMQFGDPFIGTRMMTIYGDDNISDGVIIENNEVTTVVSTNNNDNYKIDILGTTFSMIREGNNMLALNPQPQYFDTWITPNSYMLSDGSNGAFLHVGKDPNPLDISIGVATWAPPAVVSGSQLAGQWKIKWVYDDNLKDNLLSPFSIVDDTFSIIDLGGGQVSVQLDGTTPWLMNVNGNKLEPAEALDPSIVYLSIVTDGKGMAITLIGVETYDPTDVSARIGLAAPIN